MKIGLVCRKYLTTVGGLERYSLTLSAELVRRGHEVHVFAHRAEPRSGVHIHRVPIVPLSSPGKNLSFALWAPRRIAGWGLDVVQSMERIWRQDIFRASDGINPVQMESCYPNPWVRRFKAAGPRRRVLTLLEKRIFEGGGARMILTNSNMVKRQILSHYRVSPERIAVLYNAVDTRRFNPPAVERRGKTFRERHGIGPEELLILFVGNNFRLKGLALLIEAFSKLPSQRVRLVAVGKGNPGPYLDQAAKAGVADRVIFPGHQKHPESCYGAADLLVLPTRYDPFANVCLEAMACGLPVVTTDRNGAAEIFTSGREGVVLTSGTAGELAAAIGGLTEPGRRGALGRLAATLAAGFTMDHYISGLSDLYERLREMKNDATRERKDRR